MSHFNAGSTLPDFCCSTVDGKTARLTEYLCASEHTLLLLLRFYGCPMTQFTLSELKSAHAMLQDAGIQILAVVQSPAETVLQYVAADSFPFPVVCDPEERIYRLLDTDSQRADFDITQVKDPAVWDKLHRMSDAGFTLLKEEGNPLQLPATFLLTSDGSVLYSQYGTWAGDTPDPETIVEKLKSNQS